MAKQGLLYKGRHNNPPGSRVTKERLCDIDVNHPIQTIHEIHGSVKYRSPITKLS